jgi:hypothetical protein
MTSPQTIKYDSSKCENRMLVNGKLAEYAAIPADELIASYVFANTMMKPPRMMYTIMLNTKKTGCVSIMTQLTITAKLNKMNTPKISLSNKEGIFAWLVFTMFCASEGKELMLPWNFVTTMKEMMAAKANANKKMRATA